MPSAMSCFFISVPGAVLWMPTQPSAVSAMGVNSSSQSMSLYTLRLKSTMTESAARDHGNQ